LLEAFAPGKVILLGEHGVVYGYPALAGPLSKGVTARGVNSVRCRIEIPPSLDSKMKRRLVAAFERAAAACDRPAVSVRLEATLPVSMGLGSSAALSVACARVLLIAAGRPGADLEVAFIAEQMEREFHGTPSGLDQAACASSELICCRRSPRAKAAMVKVVKCKKPLRVVIALGGKRSSTRETVASVRSRQERWPQRYKRLFAEIGRLTIEGVKAVQQGDFEALGDAMNVNQGILSALQVSSPAIEAMVGRLRKAGALGAKLTGAGGDGGAVVGLFLEPERALRVLQREGVECFMSQIAGPPAL
jgi:mevalonate kinase